MGLLMFVFGKNDFENICWKSGEEKMSFSCEP
jgi:hypothetical protein